MTDLAFKQCDACDKRENYDDIATGWVNVRQVIGNAEGYAVIQELRQARGDIVVDQGDFCSLQCLANWASARATMKELSEE